MTQPPDAEEIRGLEDALDSPAWNRMAKENMDVIEQAASAHLAALKSPKPEVFTADEVTNLNAFQNAGVMHPFTCGTEECRHDLVATTRGWICPYCDYTQDWAHDFMKDGSAVKNNPLAALKSQSSGWMIPEGFALVPLVATEEMGRASGMRHKLPNGGAITMWAVNKWGDMLAAAPLPPQTTAKGDE